MFVWQATADKLVLNITIYVAHTHSNTWDSSTRAPLLATLVHKPSVRDVHANLIISRLNDKEQKSERSKLSFMLFSFCCKHWLSLCVFPLSSIFSYRTFFQGFSLYNIGNVKQFSRSYHDQSELWGNHGSGAVACFTFYWQSVGRNLYFSSCIFGCFGCFFTLLPFPGSSAVTVCLSTNQHSTDAQQS